MKKLFTVALALLVATAGHSQVRKVLSREEMKKVATMQKSSRMDSFENVQSQPNMTRSDGELDYTIYDWQTNAGPRNWTIVWPDGKVNFAYNLSSDNSNSDCGTGIGTYNSENDEWIPSYGRVEIEKTTFGSIARYKENGIVLVANTTTQCGVYIIEDKDDMEPNSVFAVSYLNPSYEPLYPAVMTSGSNRDIIHVVVTATAADGSSVSVPGAEGANMPIIYFRSLDGGMTWDKENIILPYMGSEYGLDWGSHICYWMETTEDNCLALVVNNPWSDGFVLYSYNNGETWEKKTFYHHPGVATDMTGHRFFYPRWVSAQWDMDGKLCLAYEFNGSTGEPGSDSYFPEIGGVAFWSETLPYHGDTPPSGVDPNNPLPPMPGQPFIMDSAYLYHDIYATWFEPDFAHGIWPEFMGYPPVEDPLSDLSLHGDYHCGPVTMPVLTVIPGSDGSYMLAVWCAIDENNMDGYGNFYFKLFASCSFNGGRNWYRQIPLITDFMYNYSGCVYPQVAVVGQTLAIAVQMDYKSGSSIMSGDLEDSDTYYQGLTFDLYSLFPIGPIGVPEVNHNVHITVYPNPAVDQLNVTLNQNADIVIYNILGQSVMTVEGHVGANTLDISNLDAGIYFVKAGFETKKCIVK